MGETPAENFYSGILGFEWDELKASRNFRKHRIDFEEATDVFYNPHVLRESKRDEEERWIAIGEAGGRIVAVIFTLRPTNIRIISARRARKMKNERTVVRRWGDRRKGRTDWAAFDALTDQEIDASITSDPDWQEFKDLDWSEAVLVIPPKKKAISIRVDEDVLDYFKKEGTGYQRRMNAVLRSYMQQMSKAKKRA